MNNPNVETAEETVSNQREHTVVQVNEQARKYNATVKRTQ